MEDEKCTNIPPWVTRKVKEITKSFPERKCLTTQRIREMKIAEKYGVSESVVEKCLEETSKIHSVPLWFVAEVVLDN